jgi:hypothetical protein
LDSVDDESTFPAKLRSYLPFLLQTKRNKDQFLTVTLCYRHLALANLNNVAIKQHSFLFFFSSDYSIALALSTANSKCLMLLFRMSLNSVNPFFESFENAVSVTDSGNFVEQRIQKEFISFVPERICKTVKEF